jgi:hypothetical protein
MSQAELKSILRAVFVTALAGGVLAALLRKAIARQQRDVPVVNPVSDAGPDVEEPLRESDLHVAQNSPL